MAEGAIVAPRATTFVIVSAALRHDPSTTMEFEVPVPHQQGAPEGAIVSAAFQVFLRLGGMSFDKEGGMDFYPFDCFQAPFKFRVKNVIAVGSAGMPTGGPVLLK